MMEGAIIFCGAIVMLVAIKACDNEENEGCALPVVALGLLMMLFGLGSLAIYALSLLPSVWSGR